MARARQMWPMALLLLVALGGCGRPNDFADSGLSGGAPDPRVEVKHFFTLEVPAVDLEAIQRKHVEECTRLGCELTQSSLGRPNQGAAKADTALRVPPQSYDAFAAILTAPPARMTYHSVKSIELGAPMMDQEKRLAAKTKLRERLTALLNDQSVKTAADLIAIEKELAQAQSEIESATAQLDQLHRRTDLIGVNISYVGVVNRFGLDLTPVYQALQAVGQTIVMSLSALVYTLAAIVPWLPILAVLVWLLRRALRRRAAARGT
ncbi:DUF4349 domain-containing protein [Bradyrhizobium oligotrophicum]